MSQDIASLSFQIDSSQADHSAQSLDRLRGVSDQLSTSSKTLSTQATDTQHSLGGMTNQVAQLQKQLQTTGPTLDDLIGKMQKARSEFSSTAQSLKSWDDAAMQVNALGRAFNTTAAGLANYTQAANGMEFTSQQTAQSLQRITLALENQTAVGAQLRKVMSEYGVSLRDLNVDQADEALRRLADRFSKTADSAKRTRDIQSVMGTLDPDALGRMVAPNYVPLREAAEQTHTRSVGLKTERDSEFARQELGKVQRDSTRGADLLKEFPLASGPRSVITPDQMKSLRSVARPGSIFATEGAESAAGRTEMLELMSRMPRDFDRLGMYGDKEKAIEAGQAARGNTMFGPGPGGEFHDERGTSMFGRMVTAATDGSYNAQRLLREADQAKRLAADNSFSGNALVTLTHGIALPILQGLNLIKLPGAPEQTRTPGFDSVGDAETMASVGDQGMLRYQQAQRTVRSFGMQKGDRQEVGDFDPETDKAADDMQDVFKGAYGNDGPAELRVRREMAMRERRNALRPGAEAVDQSRTALRISGLSLREQGEERARSAFVSSHGGDPEKAASPAVTRAFNESYANNQKTSNNEFYEQSELRVTDLRAQGQVVGQSATAMQDKVTFQQAYNKALGETSKIGEVEFRASRAVYELNEQRIVQGKAMIADLGRQNVLEERRINLLGSPEADRATRAIAEAQAAVTIATQKESDAKNGKLNEAEYAKGLTDQAKLRSNAGIGQAVGSAVDDVDKAKQLLSVSDQRIYSQTKFNRELEIDIQFTKERAALAGNDAELRAFDEKIRRIKVLRDEQSLLIGEAALYKLGRDAERTALDQAALMRVPRGDPRTLAAATQRVFNQAADSGVLPRGETAEPESGFAPAYTKPGTNIVPRADRANILQNAVAGTPISTNVLNGLLSHESHWDANAIGQDGSDIGLAQARESTRRDPGYGVAPISRQDALDPQKSASFAAQYLYLKAKHGGMADEDWANPAKVDHALMLYHNDSPGSAGYDPNYAAKIRGQMDSNLPDTSRTLEQRRGTVDFAATRERMGVLSERDINIQKGNEASQISLTQAGAGEKAMREGRTADANLARLGTAPANDGLLQAQALNNVTQALQQYRLEQVAATGQTDIATNSNERMAVATKAGGAAIGALTDKLKIEAEVRAMGNRAVNIPARSSQLDTERMSGQQLTLQQQTKSLNEQNALSQADINAGVFAGPQTRGAAVGLERANQFINDRMYNVSDSEKTGYRELVKLNETMSITQQEQQKVRDGFIQMGAASMDALNQIVLHGGSAKQVISGLLQEVAGLFLKMAEAPLKNAAGDFLTKFGGGALKLFSGLTGGGEQFGPPEAPKFNWDGPGIDSANVKFAASGGAFVGGVKMMAGGGILDRPTKFMAAGGMAVAGEVGNEAVMPLRRMPNGDLGVSGGSGGHSVTVNAPISVSGGGGQDKDGKMDPKMMDQMQKQLAESVRLAVLQGITDEKRPGGSLY